LDNTPCPIRKSNYKTKENLSIYEYKQKFEEHFIVKSLEFYFLLKGRTIEKWEKNSFGV
jgi:hypothetical protein